MISKERSAAVVEETITAVVVIVLSSAAGHKAARLLRVLCVSYFLGIAFLAVAAEMYHRWNER